jgi:hypothetical protein
MPTQALANIWYGIHGPTPPVIRADENRVVHPSTKPNPAPNTRPARIRRKNSVSMPAVPAPSGRRAAPMADSTPSMATALASIPPSATSAITTKTTTTSRTPKNSGAIDVSPNRPGASTNGQQNANRPRADATPMARRDRRRTGMARPPRAISRPPRARRGPRRP